MIVDELCDDLLAERADLFALLDGADDPWDTPTPAPGWTVRDQCTHLAWFDDAARQSIAAPDAFRAHRDEAQSRAGAAIGSFVDDIRDDHAGLPGTEVREWLRRAGDELVAAARAADPKLRVPWYGPDMSIASSITARIMETWAHGQDVADALGVDRPPSPRLPHVAFIGWRAVPNSFVAHGREVPEDPIRVEVGDVELGPEDAPNVVRGSLVDFCLVVTQRRHPDDTDLTAVGPVASEWLTIAQAFAGAPGEGRAPGQFSPDP